MPHFPKPFFKRGRGQWYVEIDRKQPLLLASGLRPPASSFEMPGKSLGLASPLGRWYRMRPPSSWIDHPSYPTFPIRLKDFPR